MSTADDSQLVELTAEQMLTVRGAANAMIDAADNPGIEIDDQFDPIRRDHAAAGRDELGLAFESLSPDGTWRGRLPPSEVQALRDAVGAIEAMVTPPMSARLLALGYRPDDADLDNLTAALDGLPAPNREDLAFSDFRYGGTDAALESRTDFEELAEVVLSMLRDDTNPRDDLRRITDRTFPSPVNNCSNLDLAIVNMTARFARLGGASGDIRADASDAFSDSLARALDAGASCYRDMDRRRINAGSARLVDAIQRGDRTDARVHALGVTEMVAWGQSNRLREQRIGLR